MNLGVLALLLGAVGCGQTSLPSGSSTALVAGNWQITSSDPGAARLSSLSGQLAGAGAGIRGVFHTNSPSDCVAPTTSVSLSGLAEGSNLVLTGTNVAGGTLIVAGTLTADGRAMTGATYTVTGGNCALSAPVHAMAQAYSPIDGNYAGTFSDPGGQVIAISAVLSQTPQSDTLGNFQLSGTGTFGSNSCFTSPATVTSSQVTGGSFNLTYSDAALHNFVNASGSFSTDGTTLTITGWSLTGACGTDSGTGLLIKH